MWKKTKLLIVCIFIFALLFISISVVDAKVEAKSDGLYVDGTKYPVSAMMFVKGDDPNGVMGRKPDGTIWKANDFSAYGFNTLDAWDYNVEWIALLRQAKEKNMMVALTQWVEYIAPVGAQYEWGGTIANARGTSYMYTRMVRDLTTIKNEGLDKYILFVWYEEPHQYGINEAKALEIYNYFRQAQVDVFGEVRFPLFICTWDAYWFDRYRNTCDGFLSEIYAFDTALWFVPSGNPDESLNYYRNALNSINAIKGNKPHIPLVQAAKFGEMSTQYFPPSPYYVNEQIRIARETCGNNFAIIAWTERYPPTNHVFLEDKGYDYYIQVLNYVKSGYVPTPVPTPTPTSTPVPTVLPTKTLTPYPTYTPYPTVLPTVIPTVTPAPNPIDDVINKYPLLTIAISCLAVIIFLGKQGGRRR